MRFLLPATAALVLLVSPAAAHSWYSKRTDPVLRNSCCGGHDCAMWAIERGQLEADAYGYRIRLTKEQAKKINPFRFDDLDGFVAYDRMQASPDGNWHLCISNVGNAAPFFGVFCLFAPPST